MIFSKKYQVNNQLCCETSLSADTGISFLKAAAAVCFIILIAMTAPAAAAGLAPLTYTLDKENNLFWNATGNYYEIIDNSKVTSITVNITVPAGYNISEYGLKIWTADYANVTDYENLLPEPEWVGVKNLEGTTGITMTYGTTDTASLLNDTVKDTFKVFIDASSIPEDYVDTITIPVEMYTMQYDCDGKRVVEKDDEPVELSVEIKIHGKKSLLTLEYYNGWFINKSKTYIMDGSDKIRDPVTGIYLSDVTPDAPRFNSTEISKVVYNCPASASVDGKISLFIAQPLLYSVSEKSLALNLSKVEAFSSDGTKVGTDGIGWFESGVFHHTCVIPADASYLTITFFGRYLGDVNDDEDIGAPDISWISQYLKEIPSMIERFTPETEFYADINQDEDIGAPDISVISQILMESLNKVIFWWV